MTGRPFAESLPALALNALVHAQSPHQASPRR
jgi:hypothetical protein